MMLELRMVNVRRRLLLARRLMRRCRQRRHMRTGMRVRMEMGVRLTLSLGRAEGIEAMHVVRAGLRLPGRGLVMLERGVEVEGSGGGAGGRSGPGVGGGRRVDRAHLLGRGMRRVHDGAQDRTAAIDGGGQE